MLDLFKKKEFSKQVHVLKNDFSPYNSYIQIF